MAPRIANEFYISNILGMSPTILTKRRLPFGVTSQDSPYKKQRCLHLIFSDSVVGTLDKSLQREIKEEPNAKSSKYAPRSSNCHQESLFARTELRPTSRPESEKDVPYCYFCRRMPGLVECDRCDRLVCELCARSCEACQMPSCRFCCVIDYSHPREVEVCLDCHAAGAEYVGEMLPESLVQVGR